MDRKKLGTISAVILLFFVLVTLATSAATTVTIPSAEVNVSESTTVPILINNVTGVKGVHILLEYDSSVVHALDIGNSDLVLELSKEINNVTGYVRYSVLSFTALNGDLKFADVTLKGMNAGSSPLNLTVESLTSGTAQIPRDVVNGTFTVVVDNPPRPNITNPQDGATLSGTIAIEEIDESGEEDIAYNLFEYYYDENCNGEEDDGNEWVEIGNDTAGGDGWSVNWDTAALTDGCYKIRAMMGDEHGQTGQDEINVTIDNTPSVGTTVTIQSAEVKVSESTTVPILINNVTGVKDAYILLEYDSSVVHALDIGNSDFDLETFKEIDNGTGYVRYSVLSSTALNGDVKFADVTLKGMNAGNSPLNLTVESLSDGTSEIPRDVVNGTFTVVVDNPPRPNITNPQDGATLSGTIAIEEIDESGEEDIAYNLFEYYYDENCNGEEDDGNEWVEIGNDTAGGDGWSVNWDTAALTDGCYKIRATMGDEQGQTGQDEINVTIDNTPSVGTTVTISSAEVGVSESTTVPIMINNVPAVKGAHILLEYDSSVVHALDIGNSDFDLETFKEIDNGTGYVRYSVFSLTALNGDVKFADVTLEGTNVGSSLLNLTVESLSDGAAQIPRNVVNGTFTVVVDNPPRPNITNPQDGATLSGTIAIEEIDESGEEDIAYNLFEYYYDENCNGEEDDGNEWVEIGNDTAGGDGWSVNWDTAALTDGCYKIRATMGDEQGQTGQDEINVMLSNHDPVPTITAPLDGATLTDLVTIVEEDTGFDAGADIVYNLFEYYYDENCNGEEDDGNEWVEIGNDTAGGDGWSVNWDTAALTDGCYKIRVTMGDEQGRTGQDEINVTIDNTPPVATDPSASPLIIPEDTDSDPRWGETSNLSVTVTDESVIASVTIDLSSIGGSAVQPMTNTGGDVWTVSTAAAIGTAVWNGTAYEPHYLQVNATDITGKSNTSASVELLVMKNGDVDESGEVNLDDAVYLTNYALHVPGYDLVPGVADVDGNGATNLDDAVYLANHAFRVPGYETLY